jgi:hypothetical protein
LTRVFYQEPGLKAPANWARQKATGKAVTTRVEDKQRFEKIIILNAFSKVLKDIGQDQVLAHSCNFENRAETRRNNGRGKPAGMEIMVDKNVKVGHTVGGHGLQHLKILDFTVFACYFNTQPVPRLVDVRNGPGLRRLGPYR